MAIVRKMLLLSMLSGSATCRSRSELPHYIEGQTGSMGERQLLQMIFPTQNLIEHPEDTLPRTRLVRPLLSADFAAQ